MCGIAGAIGKKVDQRVLQEMIGAVEYRGPNHTGTTVRGDVGLAHARLSIIDTSPLGNQPMFLPDESVAVVFNGEVYNFSELRKELQSKGHRFKSLSDTEVILWMYREEGEKCFKRFSGMFAIAIYDFGKQKLLLARDRMGEKPLYWAQKNGMFLFASEPKALLASGLIRAELNLTALSRYLLHDFIPSPLSIYNDIHKLEPGRVMIFQNEKIKMRDFWAPKGVSVEDISVEKALYRLDTLLTETIGRELVADVPLGVFLSGGLDSATIAYYARRANKSIHTFSIGFEERSFDESSFALSAAKHLGTIHRHRMVSAEDAISAIPEIFEKLDEPLADPSIIPTFLLSRFARENVTVVLGGDGGDELFAGYPTFQAEKIFSFSRHIPLLHRALHVSGRFLPVSHENMSIGFKLRKFLAGADEKYILRRHAIWLGTFNERSRRDLEQILSARILDGLVGEDIFDFTEKQTDDSSGRDAGNALLRWYQRTYLADQLLVKADRASMYNSLEIRAPFLDHTVVEFANSLPYLYKLHGFTTKYILKKLMKNKLPDEIIFRQKKGFGIPIGAWIRGPLRTWVEDILSEENIRKAGIFNPVFVKRILGEHLTLRRDNRKLLWNMIVFQLWQKKWIQ